MDSGEEGVGGGGCRGPEADAEETEGSDGAGGAVQGRQCKNQWVFCGGWDVR